MSASAEELQCAHTPGIDVRTPRRYTSPKGTVSNCRGVKQECRMRRCKHSPCKHSPRYVDELIPKLTRLGAGADLRSGAAWTKFAKTYPACRSRGGFIVASVTDGFHYAHGQRP